ncbi:MAG: aminotransferase class I/II-fold pyridoxal phosphate-dependent enzyme [Oscillospiraceae bacterium]|nr:aminotransferase class I/II-fold pyridoxal phosphate-dependent enzyme [Oscillospiraceae bacterium]
MPISTELWSERIKAQKPYIAGEQPKNSNLIKLNTNENPYAPAAGDALLRLYPDPDAAGLCAAIAEVSGVTPERVFAGNGSDEVLAFAFIAFFGGGKVYAPDITYSFYPVWASLFGAEYITIPLDAHFDICADDYLTLDGGVILANPNAPTGKVLPLRDVERIVSANPDRVVIIDEAYIDFAPDGSSAVPLTVKYPNLLVTQTASKAYSLAGLRVGWAIGSESLIAALNTVKNCVNSYTIDRNAQETASETISARAVFRRNTERVIRARDWTTAELRRLGFSVLDSGANFVFAKPPAPIHGEAGKSASELLQQLRERGILIRYFNLPRIDEYLRISIGTSEQMKALISALEELL